MPPFSSVILRSEFVYFEVSAKNMGTAPNGSQSETKLRKCRSPPLEDLSVTDAV